jgi:hypothetical protein
MGDAWGGFLLLLVGVAIVARTLRGTLTTRVLTVAGKATTS